MIWSLLLQFSLLAHCDMPYHKDRAVRPVLEKAQAIRNHTLQQQTKTTLQQVYSHLNTQDIEAMRSKAISLAKTETDRQYYDIENETEYELLYFYIEAVKQIPGATIISEYTPKKPPVPRKDFWGKPVPQPTPLSVTDNPNAKAFRVFGNSIDFIIDNKLYKIRPSLFGRTSMYLVSPDAAKYQAATEMCFKNREGLTEKQQRKNCEDLRAMDQIKYRIRNDIFEIKNDYMQFYVEPSFDHKGNGSVRIADDKLTNSAFTAAVLESNFTSSYYLNGNKTEFRFTDAQQAQIDQIQKESIFSPGSAPTSPAKAAN